MQDKMNEQSENPAAELEAVLYTDDEVKRRAQRIVEIANKYEGYDELALASVPVTVLRAVAMVVNGAAFAPLVARMAATHPAPALDGVREAHKAGWTAAEIKFDLRKFGTVFESEEDAWESYAALSSPSVGIAPASSGAGDARIVEWLRGADNSLPDLDSDYASAARQAVYCIDLADAIERGDHLSTPLSHDAEGESATVSREGELREALRPFAFAWTAWNDLRAAKPKSHGAMAGPKGFVALSEFEDAAKAFALSTPATSTERGR